MIFIAYCTDFGVPEGRLAYSHSKPPSNGFIPYSRLGTLSPHSPSPHPGTRRACLPAMFSHSWLRPPCLPLDALCAGSISNRSTCPHLLDVLERQCTARLPQLRRQAREVAGTGGQLERAALGLPGPNCGESPGAKCPIAGDEGSASRSPGLAFCFL